jgi:hypothetical protein
MSNREVAGLQALAKKHGGELSVNPDTGLPEAGFLDNILPTIAGAGLTYFSGGTISPLMAAGIVGGISALDSKDLSKGLMAGLGAYGGGSMVGGLAGMGLEAGAAATATAPAQEAAMQAAIDNGTYQNAVGAGASNFGELFKSAPMDALSAAGGGSGFKAAGILGAAAAPMLADEMVETTTEAPEQSRGMIRPYTYSRQQAYPTQDYQGQQGNMGSKERRYFNESYTAGDPYAAANGGLVALAGGGDMRRRRGYEQQSLFTPTTPLPANNMYGASRDAYDYLMGVNTPSGTGGTGGGTGGTGGGGDTTTPPTGTGKYEFDPVTKKYKWVPDPIKPADVTAPVFENAAQVGGGGGGRRTAPEDQPGEGFNPTSEGAYNVSRFGQAVSSISPLIGGVIGGYGNYLARNVDPNYGHEAMNTTAGKVFDVPTIDADTGEIVSEPDANTETAADAMARFTQGYPLTSTEKALFRTSDEADQMFAKPYSAADEADAMFAAPEAVAIKETVSDSNLVSPNEIANFQNNYPSYPPVALNKLDGTVDNDFVDRSFDMMKEAGIGDFERAQAAKENAQRSGIAALSDSYGGLGSSWQGLVDRNGDAVLTSQGLAEKNFLSDPSNIAAANKIAAINYSSPVTDPSQKGLYSPTVNSSTSESSSGSAKSTSDGGESGSFGPAPSDGRAPPSGLGQAARDAETSRSSPTATSGGPSASSSTGNAPMGANAAPSDGGAPPSGGGGGGGGGGRVICTHFYSKGEMSRDMWRADLEFTFKNLSPTTVRGYQYWAIPYVKLMRKSKLAENIMRPLAMHRAKELSYQMGQSPKGSLFGKLVRLVGEPICFTVGLFVGEQNWQSLWKPAKD